MSIRTSAWFACGAAVFAASANASASLSLEARTVDMTRYEQARVLVLPVEVNPVYSLEKEESRAIQDQVKNTLIDVFHFQRVNSEEKVVRLVGYTNEPGAIKATGKDYPYTLGEVRKLGELYKADAVVAISVYSLTRADRYRGASIGVRITFADTRDESSTWTLSREFRSEESLTGSRSFEDALELEFRNVQQKVRPGKMLFGLLPSGKGESAAGAPIVLINLLSDDAGAKQQAPAASPTKGTFDTEQSTVQFRLVAEDSAGLRNTVINNKAHANFSYTIEHRLPEKLQSARPEPLRYVSEIITVPLAVGENVVEFTTSNVLGKSTPHQALVTRHATRSVYALVVGIKKYLYYPSNPRGLPDVFREQLEAATKDSGGHLYLADEDATQSNIARGIYELRLRTYHNELATGVFYFTGAVQTSKEGVFLVAFDSEPDLLEVTAIDVGVIEKSLAKNGVAIFDLCEPSPDVQAQMLSQAKGAIVSFDSCEPGRYRMAEAIDRQLRAGTTLRQALETLSAQSRSRPVQ